MTLVHKHSDFQSKIELRGSTLSCYVARIKSGMFRSGKKDEELTPEYVSSLSNYDESDKAALNEVLFMDDDVTKQEDDYIKMGLKTLNFRENPHIPNVPDEVIEKGCEDKYYFEDPDDPIKDILKAAFPSLDESTIVALIKRSDCDMRPSSMMLVGKFVIVMFHKLMYTYTLYLIFYFFQWEITLLVSGTTMSYKDLLKPSTIIWHLTI